MHRIPLVALFASLATATLLGRDVSQKECKKHPNSRECENKYLQNICAPGLSNADTNLKAPCNIHAYIGLECTYGQKINVNKNGLEIPTGKTKSNSTQRLCICESEYFNAALGCVACFQAHGGAQDEPVPSSVINSLSSAYCAATATPSLGIFDYQQVYLDKPQFSSLLSSSSGTATSTFSDPIGNKTDVSLYWTAPVTGTAILDIGEFTGTAKPTTTDVLKGEIVATASPSAQNTATTTGTGNTAVQTTGQTGASPSAGTTTTSGMAARQTEAIFAGVIGLVGVVAML